MNILEAKSDIKTGSEMLYSNGLSVGVEDFMILKKKLDKFQPLWSYFNKISTKNNIEGHVSDSSEEINSSILL